MARLKPQLAAIQALQATYTNEKTQRLILSTIPPHSDFKGGEPVYAGIFFIHDSIARSQVALRAFFRKIKRRKQETLWVVCASQDPEAKSQEADTHCLGFVYQPREKKLFAFDPGSLCWGASQDLLDIIQIFLETSPKTSKNTKLLTTMQCNCTDTYCQSWSLLFLVEYKQTHSMAFVQQWDALSPARKRKCIANFMMFHATSDDEFLTYKYHIMYDWWRELQNHHQYDVYWDYANGQSLIHLAELGFGGYGRTAVPKGRVINLRRSTQNLGKWPRPQQKSMRA